MSVRDLVFDYSDFSGGKNSTFQQFAIAENQVYDTLNHIHLRNGVKRAPGYHGILKFEMFQYVKPLGLFTYKLFDGTEYLICVLNNGDGTSNIYNVVYNAEIPEEYEYDNTYILENMFKFIATIDGDGVPWAVNAINKLWIVNGTSFVKIESDLVSYRVGINQTPVLNNGAPEGTATVVFSYNYTSTIPLGEYKIYASYGRTVNGQSLYGLPGLLKTYTVTDTEELYIAANTPLVSDPQINMMTFWMTEANGETPYFLAELSIGAELTLTDLAQMNTAMRMDALAAPNESLPINPVGIAAINDALYVWGENNNTIYWSIRSDINPFNLEIFPTENFRTFSNKISSVFSCSENIYINSIGNGISVIPSGDMSAVLKTVEKRLWFLPCKTEEGKTFTIVHKGFAWGMTNDGLRYFDGSNNQMSEDLSFTIKSDIDVLYDGMLGDVYLAMSLYRRRGVRTELRISYRDTVDNTYATSNNKQMVFNLDNYFDSGSGLKTWELWNTGFCSYAIIDNIICMLQGNNNGSVVCVESGVSDIYIYDVNESYLSTLTPKRTYLLSKQIIDRLDSITVWGPIYTFAYANSSMTGNVIIYDKGQKKYPFDIIGSKDIVVLPADPGALPLPVILASQQAVAGAQSMAYACNGNSVAIEIEQTADDEFYSIYKIQMPKVKEVIHKIT